MNKFLTALATCLLLGAAAANAAGNADFSGKWALNAATSTNLGMMSVMQISLDISQSATELLINETTSFQGQPGNRQIRYDLTGKPVMNDSPMAGKSETVASWVEGKLVVTWTNEGAVAGTKVSRTETRWLSADGKAMSVQTVRGENKPVIMVFDRK
jgi:hypothetical protein